MKQSLEPDVGGRERGQFSSSATAAWLVLAIALLVGGAIRGWQIRESLWLDELHTAWVLAGSPGEIAERARIGNQSPLYFYLLKLPTSFLGTGEVTLRLPSFVAGMASVLLVYFVVVRWTGSIAAGLCVSMLLAIDPRAVFYSQEARPHGLVQLCALLHVYVFWRLQRGPDRVWRLAAILLGVLLFWLHYTTALLLLAEGAWYLLLLAQARTAYRPKQLAADTAGLMLGLLTALPHVCQVFGARSNWAMFIDRRSPGVAVQWFSLPIYVFVPVAISVVDRLAWRWVGREPAARQPDESVGQLVVFWFLIPTSAAWFLTWNDIARLFFPRYLLASGIAPLVFAGWLVAGIGTRGGRLATVVLLVALSIWSGGMVEQFLDDGRFLADRNQDWRGAVALVNQQFKAHPAPVFVRSGLIEADDLHSDSSEVFRQYCLLPVTGLYRLDTQDQQLIPLRTSIPGSLNETLVERVWLARGCWCVVNGSTRSHQRFVDELRTTLLGRGMKFDLFAQRRFGQVLVLAINVAEARRE